MQSSPKPCDHVLIISPPPPSLIPRIDRSPFTHLDSRFERGEFQRREEILAREMDDTHHSPLPVAGRAIRRWEENMSGQTIRRSRVAAYFGQGFYPVGFVRYIYMYTHTHTHALIILFTCRLYGNSRSSWRKSSICNLNLFSRQKARSHSVSAIVLEIVLEIVHLEILASLALSRYLILHYR